MNNTPRPLVKMGKKVKSFRNYEGKDAEALKHQEIETPLRLVDELMEYIDPKNFDKVLDPCVGPGNMVKRIIEEELANVLTLSDIQEKHVT